MLDALQKLESKTSQQRSAGVRALCDGLEDGRAKLLIVRSALELRKRWPDVFQKGKYLRLPIKGKHAVHLCAYARIDGRHKVITLAPRFFAQLLSDADTLPLGEKVWGNTTVDLPFHRSDDQYTCVFTGKGLKPHQQLSGWCLSIAELLADFPVGLISVESEHP